MISLYWIENVKLIAEAVTAINTASIVLLHLAQHFLARKAFFIKTLLDFAWKQRSVGQEQARTIVC